MTKLEFLEKTLEGLWRPIPDSIVKLDYEEMEILVSNNPFRDPYRYSFNDILCDPRAWRAVGVVKNWDNDKATRMKTLTIQDSQIQRAHDEDFRRILTRETKYQPWWILNMLRCFEFVANGGTVTKFLETL